MTDLEKIPIERIDPCRVRVHRHGGMRVDGLVFADAPLLEGIRRDQALQQVINVAHLPGIVGASLGMPDIHWGYGFPIGGVAAFDPREGVISPGGVGYDINCGVRLLASGLHRDTLREQARVLADRLYANIPSGVGSHRTDLRLSQPEMRRVLLGGAPWAIQAGYGEPADLDHIEEGGRLEGAEPDRVSERAIKRGSNQLGTIGSGNHFVEAGYVAEIFDQEAAQALGLARDRVTLIIHTGSRGLGYQTCDESIQTMLQASRKYGIHLPDKQLCAAPAASPEGRTYLGAMMAAANFAFANRQLITHFARETFRDVFRADGAKAQLRLIYDVCHNIAKWETHQVNGDRRRLLVHRKGATRAFPPGHPQTPKRYQAIGQPVLIPGDMGRYSYVLAGTAQAFAETFGSTCHGAGRRLSRSKAKKLVKGRRLVEEFEQRGIYLRAAGFRTLAEEVPEAYKDVSDVVNVVCEAGISRLVAKLVPVAVVKG